jgi:hypothetical protein
MAELKVTGPRGHFERSRMTTKTWLAKVAMLAAFTVIPSVAQSQELPLTAPSSAASKGPAEVITCGTSKERVDSYLGTPSVGSTIFCLHRAMYSYEGGTKIIFVDGRVVSAVPGGLAIGNPGQGFTVEHKNKQVFFEPVILCGVDIPGPAGETKRLVEDCLIFAPPMHAVTGVPALPENRPCCDFVPSKRILLY